jgi:hypothetical protein
MYWVLQDDIYGEEGFGRLLEALDHLRLPHSVHKVRPFVGTLDPEPQPPPGPVVVMGSYSLVRIARERGWRPGAWTNDSLDFVEQDRRWGAAMFNHGALVVPLSDVPEQREPFFLRPCRDTKEFAGRVMDWRGFEKWRASATSATPENGAAVPAGLPVMVCRRRSALQEHRLWIVGGRAVTASTYRKGSWKHYDARVDPHVVEFGERMAVEWSPADAYAMDVAETDDGPRIMEVNNINAAGFYAADMNRLVIALEDLVARQGSA